MTESRPQAIELQIEELVLHGFDPADRAGLAAAVERALGRLLAARGLPPGISHGGAQARLDGGSFTVTPDTNVEAMGAQVAQAIYGGLA